MEAILSSETLANFYRAIQRKTPENRSLHRYSYENFKSNAETKNSDKFQLLWHPVPGGTVRRGICPC
jgi:hypothetical protein